MTAVCDENGVSLNAEVPNSIVVAYLATPGRVFEETNGEAAKAIVK